MPRPMISRQCDSYSRRTLIAAEVAQRYADLVQALYRERKNVTQMLAVARAAIAHCLDAAERSRGDRSGGRR